MVSLAITVMPVYFYFQMHRLIFPNIKDMIDYELFNKEEVLKQTDPQR